MPPFYNIVECDVIQLDYDALIPSHPYEHDHKAMHDGVLNQYNLLKAGNDFNFPSTTKTDPELLTSHVIMKHVDMPWVPSFMCGVPPK